MTRLVLRKYSNSTHATQSMCACDMNACTYVYTGRFGEWQGRVMPSQPHFSSPTSPSTVLTFTKTIAIFLFYINYVPVHVCMLPQRPSLPTDSAGHKCNTHTCIIIILNSSWWTIIIISYNTGCGWWLNIKCWPPVAKVHDHTVCM